MFTNDALHKRGQALEDEFFHRVDEKLRMELREKLQREEARERFVLATGFQDAGLIDHLLDAGFEPSSIAALALVPAIFVAWTDGVVSPLERQAILSAALDQGINEKPTAFAMLGSWLNERPSDSLWELWKEYADVVGHSLSAKLASSLHREMLTLATKVAEASGGHFGRGKISAEEQAILDQITLERTPQ